MIKTSIYSIFFLILCGCSPVQETAVAQNHRAIAVADDQVGSYRETKNDIIEQLHEIQKSIRLIGMLTSPTLLGDGALKTDRDFNEKFNLLSTGIVGVLSRDTFTEMARMQSPHIELDLAQLRTDVLDLRNQRNSLWISLMDSNNIHTSYRNIYAS